MAQFNASQLITQRQEVSSLIRKRLVERARDFNILLDDVSITHLNFGKEYTAAIEAKQVAQQEAERAKFFVEKVSYTGNLVENACFAFHNGIRLTRNMRMPKIGLRVSRNQQAISCIFNQVPSQIRMPQM